MKYLPTIFILIIVNTLTFSQGNSDDRLGSDFLITYGNMLNKESGDEGCTQTVFIVIPENLTNSFFIRVFDPDCGGMNDKPNGRWETNTEFEFYGGKGCIHLHLKGGAVINSDVSQGILLQEELYADEPVIDNTWVTFGPFSAQQGEKLESYSGRFFKLVVAGKTGNDGNQYAFVISSSGQENAALIGATYYMDENTFTTDLEAGKYNYSVIAEPIDE